MPELSREEIRFLADLAARPLSTTVSRYERLKLSRRKGNAIRQHLDQAGIIQAVAIATRSGQVMLYELTDMGRSVCSAHAIDPGPQPRESLEHRWWVRKAHEYFERQGYQITREHMIRGNGAIDLLAEKPGERVAVEVETGKSDVAENLAKIRKASFDRIIVIATSPVAVTACTRILASVGAEGHDAVQMLTWLDVS
jgi:HJR/Mrr/RecB family endonuclease